MKAEINLKALLDVTDESAAHNNVSKPKKEPNQISLEYLTALKETVGPRLAIETATRYPAEKIFEMEKIYDNYDFTDVPRTPKIKLERILSFIELSDKLDVASMSRNHNAITDTYKDFTKIMESITSRNNPKLKDYFFLRDVINGVPEKLLSEYGIEADNKNIKEGHVGKVYGNKKVLFGISTKEIMDFLVEKQIQGVRINESNIVAGFDSPATALEVATRVGNSNTARLLVRCGFKTKEQVISLNPDELIVLYEDSFNYKGNLDSQTYHDICFDKYVGSYIKGDNKKLHNMIKIGMNDGKEYLRSFDGDVTETLRLIKMPKDERPSPESIKYARDIMQTSRLDNKIKFQKTIETAKAIDDEDKHIFDVKIDNVEGFIQYKKDYHELKEKYQKIAGSQDFTDRFDYKKIKNFEGDWRFLAEFSAPGASSKVKIVMDNMDYDTYNALNVSSKAYLIPELLEKGYAIDEIKKTFSKERKADGNVISQTFEKLRSAGYTLQQITEMSEIPAIGRHAGRGIDTTISYLKSLDFKKEGIPFLAIDAFISNDIRSPELKTFVETVGIKKYRLDDGKFDVPSMIRDFNTFYNKDEKKKKNLDSN